MALEDIGTVVEDFFRCTLTPFTPTDFRNYLKSHKIRVSLPEITDILYSAECTFGLINNTFLTRAGAFTNQLFSFKPTKEEVERGGFIPGHRFMPFVDPAIYPYNATIILDGEEVPKNIIELNTNTVLDLHALYGEGYIIPYILSDPAGERLPLTTVQYGLPKNLSMTAFSLEPFFKKGFKYGDRLLCKVTNWDEMIIEIKIQKGNGASFKMSAEDFEREEWYSKFEDAFIQKMDKCGPCRSIEEQLAFLFLEEQQELCVENCGSCSEFLEHTTKLNFEPYGIESRIWKVGEEITFFGNWNQDASALPVMPDLSILFADCVVDSYIKTNLSKNQLEVNRDEILKELFPDTMKLNEFEQQFVMLHIEKRIDIVKKGYSRFVDYPIADCRRQVLKLFSRICSLMGSVGSSNHKLKDLPQQELIVLSQLLGHVAHILEEIETEPATAAEEKEDILTSLDGLIDTFDNIEIPILQALSKKVNVFDILG